ncbi:MAG: ParB/Srx family N-terminal domain-containing protein [Burkholderiaceae bacterium]|nr:ParB/Srx family N-terminal domain-containing protein [Burkholderiaceae bacterium]
MSAPLLPGRIEHLPLARLRPCARNAKPHDADMVARIAAGLAELGWTVPCFVVADGELIAGYGRILAAAQLGLAEVPVIVLGLLTEVQRRALSNRHQQADGTGRVERHLATRGTASAVAGGSRSYASRHPKG